MLSLAQFIARLRFLRTGVRTRLLRAMGLPPRAFESGFFGLQYQGNTGNLIDSDVLLFGAYEREELLFLQHWLHDRPRRVCLDVGANSGHHTLFFATQFQRVHAFEPYAPVLSVLRERVSTNRLNERVVSHPFGLSNDDRLLPFHPPPDANTGTGWFGDCAPTDTHLQVRRGDDVVREHGIRDVDFIKLDVEGHELLAFEGLRHTIARDRPVVWIEWNYPDDPGMVQRLHAALPERYDIVTLAVNQPLLGFFNDPRGSLIAPRFNELCNLLLVPRA